MAGGNFLAGQGETRFDTQNKVIDNYGGKFGAE